LISSGTSLKLITLSFARKISLGENMQENETSFRPTEAWPLQETYKKQLHESIQRWGEAVVPVLNEAGEESRTSMETFFEFLMESVTRGDARTANLIRTLQRAMIESTRSWYTDKLGSLDKATERKMIQRDFSTLYQIYLAGQQSMTA
jgi:hypothetical protein